LAEASLYVTGARGDAEFRSTVIDRAALETGRARSATAGEPSVELVSMGWSAPQHSVVVVDAEGKACTDDVVGEVCVAGPSVAVGYWCQPDKTLETFGTQVRSSDDRYLRTGDLGFLNAGELFVTGRIKDTMIVRGRNIYPQDVELLMQTSDPRLRAGCGAAFTLEDNEGIILVQETGETDVAECESLVLRIRAAVIDALQVPVAGVAIVPPRSVPKTTSGKVRRLDLTRAYTSGDLPVIAEWRRDGTSGSPAINAGRAR
jgi:acyl-CoA synthetase (AMP-forming)/AMP-acid ligase II